MSSPFADVSTASTAAIHDDFARFVAEVEPRLRRALVGAVGVDDTADAVAQSFAWAWENWQFVTTMTNPAGYLYRVARSSVHRRVVKTTKWLVTHDSTLPDYEPGLGAAMATLTPNQRTAVWLVYGCDWSYRDASEALGVSASTLGNHLARGLAKLRKSLGEDVL